MWIGETTTTIIEMLLRNTLEAHVETSVQPSKKTKPTRDKHAFELAAVTKKPAASPNPEIQARTMRGSGSKSIHDAEQKRRCVQDQGRWPDQQLHQVNEMTTDRELEIKETYEQLHHLIGDERKLETSNDEGIIEIKGNSDIDAWCAVCDACQLLSGLAAKRALLRWMFFKVAAIHVCFFARFETSQLCVETTVWQLALAVEEIA